jgi:selenide,water dikinase
LPHVDDPNLLVGSGTSDDSAVYRLNDDIALVQSLDFFPPIVDDPYSFGAIAAANSLSDIYAMGATPLIGLNIVCFPIGLSKDILAAILKGGADKMTEAGAIIAGGHTIDDPEPKYGISVTGLVRPGDQIANVGARPGDRLILTKPIGTGIITTALKAGKGDRELERRTIEVMSALNKSAAESMVAVGVNACTDITGFGLLGHLREMVQGSGVGARISLASVPTIPGLWPLAEDGIAPGGSKRNLDSLRDVVVWEDGLSYEAKIVLADAQTSGGLLISVASDKADDLMSSLADHGVSDARIIGEVLDDPKARITVTS